MGCLRGFATLHAFDFRAFEEPGLPNREWLTKAKTPEPCIHRVQG